MNLGSFKFCQKLISDSIFKIYCKCSPIGRRKALISSFVVKDESDAVVIEFMG